jgi:hypothetical protein
LHLLSPLMGGLYLSTVLMRNGRKGEGSRSAKEM